MLHLLIVSTIVLLLSGSNAIPNNGNDQKAILNGRYQLLERLGAGGYGQVYRAQDISNGEMVAIKQSAPNEKARELAETEAQMIRDALCGRDSRGVVEIRDQFPCGQQQFCLVLELLSCDLIKHSANMRSSPENEKLGKIRAMARDLLPALARMAQRGMVHSDIKLENILVDESTGSYKLADFGLAFHQSTSSKARIQGTWPYMSPEVIANGKMTPASDIWAFGVTLLNAFLHVNAFGFNGNGVNAAQQALALKWEHWLGRMPDQLRERLSLLGFQLMPKGIRQWPHLDEYLAGKDEDWLSPELEVFRDFLGRCLEYDPNARITAKQALKHPFVTGQGSIDESMEGRKGGLMGRFRNVFGGRRGGAEDRAMAPQQRGNWFQRMRQKGKAFNDRLVPAQPSPFAPPGTEYQQQQQQGPRPPMFTKGWFKNRQPFNAQNSAMNFDDTIPVNRMASAAA